MTLASAIRRAAQAAAQREQPIVVSVVERTWLQEATTLFARGRLVTADRFLYSRPGEAISLAGFGVAAAIDGVGAARFRQIATARHRLLAGAMLEGLCGLPGTGPLFFGGFRFDPVQPATSLWRGFPDGRLVMPRVLYTQRGDEATLTMNVVVTPQTDPDREAAELVTIWQELLSLPTPSSRPQPAILTTQDVLPTEVWKASVGKAAAQIRNDIRSTVPLEKIVLARGVQLHTARDMDLTTALRKLAAEYPHCHVFAIAQDEDCFLGATPERLVQLEHRQVTTMSLAGSIRRGKTPEEDQALGHDLLNSAKDRHEHAVVVNEIKESLRGYVELHPVGDQPALLKLGNVQHLCTPITGDLINGYSVLDLVAQLHPTPAVGGRPRHAALQRIRQIEGLDRGWYAAPVGWIDAEGDGEFVVALRSALVRGDHATLFAGCGIVGDSDPELEYAESALKLRPMLSALTAQ
jgi:isochorismate synthase